MIFLLALFSPSVSATGGESGEAHGVSWLQLRVSEVAAVQPERPISRAGPQAAPRSVQRLPHAGLWLCAPLHSGKQLMAAFTPNAVFPSRSQ